MHMYICVPRPRREGPGNKAIIMSHIISTHLLIGKVPVVPYTRLSYMYPESERESLVLHFG